MKVTLNHKQKLYVIPCDGGFTTLGFNVLEQQATALAKEINVEWIPDKPSVKQYERYQTLLLVARGKHNKTGWQSTSQLTPQLIGLEHCHVEVIDAYGECRRFMVGKSTGFIPCHLEIRSRQKVNGKWMLIDPKDDGSGGPAVIGAPFESVKVTKR